MNLMFNCIETEFKLEQQGNLWDLSYFVKIDKLKNNNSGRVGENFVFNLLKNNFECEKSNNFNNGTYDLKVFNKKIEIKTARIGKNNSFQHENLRNKDCDFFLFIDIEPNHFYITIIPCFNMFNKHKIINRKPHLRKGTSNVF